MSFFEPLPPPPPRPTNDSWAPPLWDRPSEGTLPVTLPVNEVVLRGEQVVVAIESVRVYRNGFVIELALLFDPRGPGRFGVPGHDHPMHFPPRVGVRFADGREGGRQAPQFAMQSVRKDEHGVPLDPVVRMTGGGGGGQVFRANFWIFPLPPEGPVDIFVATPSVSTEEASVTLDGTEIRAAAANATVIWS